MSWCVTALVLACCSEPCAGDAPFERVGCISTPVFYVMELVDGELVAAWVVAFEIGIPHKRHFRALCTA